MACLNDYTLKGISLDCDANLAGIKEIYLGYFGDFEVTVSETGSANTHTVTAMSASTTGAKIHKYELARQTGSLTSTLTKDDANGTRYYTTEIGLSFNKLEGWKHMEIEAMAAEQLIAIVGDNNGKYWYVGYDSYVGGTAATAQAGTSFDDKNGYDVTLSQMSAHMPYAIEKSIFESFID